MLGILTKAGKTEVLETTYNTFRGSRNLRNRNIHVKEFLYLVEKS
jgi:adenine-specific DNA-methyltransferase